MTPGRPGERDRLRTRFFDFSRRIVINGQAQRATISPDSVARGGWACRFYATERGGGGGQRPFLLCPARDLNYPPSYRSLCLLILQSVTTRVAALVYFHLPTQLLGRWVHLSAIADRGLVAAPARRRVEPPDLLGVPRKGN